MRSFGRNVFSALISLREQGSRSVLSATGIFVGSLAILLLVSIATGVQRDVTGQVRELGVNVLVVIPGRIEGQMFNPNLGGQSYLKPKHVQPVLQVPGVRSATPMSFVGGGIRAQNKEAFPLIVAAGPEWFSIRPVQMQEGRPFRADEAGQDVAVIGSIAKRDLFGDASAVGKPVKINGKTYRVVGVTQDKESEQSLFSMGSFENIVVLPFQAAARATPDLQTHRLMIQTAPDAEPKALVKSIDAALATQLDRQQYSVLTQEDLLGLVYKLMSILTWLLTGLTSIALFVGGVGIMTVMLMSVGERAREIGIRKTVGARRSDVFFQFLVEAVVLALVGGLAGLAASVAVGEALTRWTPIHPVLTPAIVALGLGVSLLVGTTFGVLPAMRAARMDPVTALRHE